MLLANIGMDEDLKVKIVNVERWRIHPTIYTLDFQIVDPKLEVGN